jgi:hypothetical protein
MEFCPHGARLVFDERGVVLLDPCSVCEEILLEHPDAKVPRPVAA